MCDGNSARTEMFPSLQDLLKRSTNAMSMTSGKFERRHNSQSRGKQPISFMNNTTWIPMAHVLSILRAPKNFKHKEEGH